MALRCSAATQNAAANTYMASRGGAVATDAGSFTGGCFSVTGTAIALQHSPPPTRAAIRVRVFTVNSTITLECDANNVAQVVAWVSTARNGVVADACSGSTLIMTNNYVAGTLPSRCGGSLPVTFTVRDPCGNQVVQTAAVTIHDTLAPVITRAASNLTLDCSVDTASIASATLTSG
jgi:hypothetical protein